MVSGGAFAHTFALLWLLLKNSTSTGLFGAIFPLLIAAISGISNGVFNTQLNAMVAMLFKHNTEGSFAQYRVWHSASVAVVYFVGPYISFQVMLVVMLVSLSISVGSFLFLTLKVERAFSSNASCY